MRFVSSRKGSNPIDFEQHVVYCNFPDDVVRDEQTGEIKGLGVDVMRKACKMARKTCVSVFSRDRYDNVKQYSLGRWRYKHNVDGD